MIATATVRYTVTSRQHLLPTHSSQVQRTPHTSVSHNRPLTPCTWPVARHGSRDCSPHIGSTATLTSTCHMPHATCQQTCAEQKCCCNMQTMHPDLRTYIPGRTSVVAQASLFRLTRNHVVTEWSLQPLRWTLLRSVTVKVVPVTQRQPDSIGHTGTAYQKQGKHGELPLQTKAAQRIQHPDTLSRTSLAGQ
jgi:hypothetical protein